jgi:hypothetical protein
MHFFVQSVALTEATGRPTHSKESEENPHSATEVHMEPLKKVQPSANCTGRAL